jgi:hypothetical protein
MEWKTVLDIAIPQHQSNDKIVGKSAKLICGNGQTTTDGKIQPFKMLKIDLRIEGTNRKIGVSMNQKEFEWFLGFVKSNTSNGIYIGKKILIVNRFVDKQISLTQTDNDRIYGLVLHQSECEFILQKQDIFMFFFNYRGITGERLKNLTFWIFINSIGSLIYNEPVLKRQININGENQIDSKTMSVLNALFNDYNFINKFTKDFQQLMILNDIKQHDITEQLSITVPAIKADEKKFSDGLYEYFKKKNTHGNIINEILQYINQK